MNEVALLYTSAVTLPNQARFCSFQADFLRDCTCCHYHIWSREVRYGFYPCPFVQNVPSFPPGNWRIYGQVSTFFNRVDSVKFSSLYNNIYTSYQRSLFIGFNEACTLLFCQQVFIFLC